MHRSVVNLFIGQMFFSTITKYRILKQALCTLLTTRAMQRPNIRVHSKKGKNIDTFVKNEPGSVTLCC